MNPKVLSTAKAEQVLVEIWSTIAEDNPRAADAFLQVIKDKSSVLYTAPEIGRQRDELAPDLRSFPIGTTFFFTNEFRQES